MNLEECWQLVNLAEQKQLNCMILENCCYDWFEMRTLNMAQHGVFGEILRAQGAYIHNLDDSRDYYWKNPDGSDPDQLGWRLKYNRDNRGDLYATHGLGPVAQALDIHRGDRMVTLVSMDTKSVHGKELVEAKTGKPCDNFRNGDHTTTLIRTENQKVIELQHDVMNPQPYNRLYQLTGTRGFANKYPIEGYALDSKQLSASGVQPKVDNLSTHSFMPEAERKALEEKYDHPILKKFGKLAKEVGGHGGMDFVMTARLVYCLQNGLPLDMDVYDLAEWCSIAELSALSLDNDCAPVAVPDFTRGLWNRQKGYRHAYASAEEEAATEATANAFTKAYKGSHGQTEARELYDKVAQAKSETARRKAQAALDKATAKRQGHGCQGCGIERRAGAQRARLNTESMSNIKIRKGLFDTQLELEHAAVMAGFPSPADDYRHDTLDFNKDYIRHPEASFYGDVEGDSMKDAGIFDGDRVIIDRAVEPHNGSIVVAFGTGSLR